MVFDYKSGYSQTESRGTGTTHISKYMPINGSVGKASANVSIKIFDDEICIQLEGVVGKI